MSGIALDVSIKTEQAAKEIADLLDQIVRGSKEAYRELARVLGQDIESRYFLDVQVDEGGVKTLIPKLVEGNKELDKLVRTAKKGVSVNAGSLTSLRQVVNNAKQARDSLNVVSRTKIDGKEVNTYNTAWLRANQTLRESQQELKRAELATQGIGGRLAAAFNLGPIRSFARGLQDIVGAFQSVAIITGQVTGAINALTATASRLQQFELAFKAIGQGSSGAIGALEEAKRISLGLGSDLDQVTNTFQQLTPVVTATGGSVEDVSGIVEALSSRFAAFGITGDRARRVTNGIIQAFAKGKLQAEELTQQISEADAAFKTDFAAALKAAGFATKGTTEELEKLVKAGKVTVDVLTQTLPLIGKSDLLFGKLGNSAKSSADALRNGSATIGQVENQFRNLSTLSLRNLAGSAEPLRNELFELRAVFIDFISDLSQTGAFDGLFNALARIISILGDLVSAVAPIAGALIRLVSTVGDLVAALTRVPGVTQLVVVLIGSKLVGAAIGATKAITGLNTAVNSFRAGGSIAQLARDFLNLNKVASATQKIKIGEAISASAARASQKVKELTDNLRIAKNITISTKNNDLAINTLVQTAKLQDRLNRAKARQASLEALASNGVRGQVRDLKGVTSAQRLRTIQTIRFAKALQRTGISASAAGSISTQAFSRFAPVILGIKSVVGGLTKGFLLLAGTVGFKVTAVILALGIAIKVLSDSFKRLTSVNDDVASSSAQTEAAIKDLSEAVGDANKRLAALRAAGSEGEGSLSDLIGSEDFNVVDEWVAVFLNGIDSIEEGFKGLGPGIEKVNKFLKDVFKIDIKNPFAFEGDLESLANEAVRLRRELDKAGISAEDFAAQSALLNNGGATPFSLNIAGAFVGGEVAELKAALDEANRAVDTAAPKIRANVDSIVSSAQKSFEGLKEIGPLFDVFFEDDGSNAAQIQQSLGGIAKAVSTNQEKVAEWRRELTRLRDRLKEAGANTRQLEIPLEELEKADKRLKLAGEAVRRFGRIVGKEFDVDKGVFIDSLEDIQREIKEIEGLFSGLNIGEDAFNEASSNLFAFEAQLERFRASQSDPLVRKQGADSSLAKLEIELSKAKFRADELNKAINEGKDVTINERKLNTQLTAIKDNIRKQIGAAFASVNAELDIAVDNSEITELEAIGTSLFQFDDGRIRQTISALADADRARFEIERTLTSEKIRAAEVSLQNQELGGKILSNAFRRAEAASVQIKGNLIQGARTAARDLDDARLSRSELIIKSRFQTPAAIAKEARRVFDQAREIINKRAAQGNPVQIPITTIEDALDLIKEEQQLNALDEVIKGLTKSLDLFLAKLAKLFGISPEDIGITPDIEEAKERYEAIGSIVDEFGNKVIFIRDLLEGKVISLDVDEGTDLDAYVARINEAAGAIENLTNLPEGSAPIELPSVDTTPLDSAISKLDDLVVSRNLLSEPATVNVDTEAAKSKIKELVTEYESSAAELENSFKQAFENATKPFEEKLKDLANITVNIKFGGLGIPGLATGGPAIGGKSYMVNELGKEGFLSKSGRLSEINRPAFGKWTAPSSGTVIPAHIWKDMKVNRNFSTPSTSIGASMPVRASLRGSGSNYDKRLAGAIIQALADRRESAAIHELSTVQAHQANEIGKLTRAVTDLTRKKWNVNVGVKTPDTSGYLQSLTSRL